MVSYTKRKEQYKNSLENTISFAKDKLKYFYPHYIVSFCIVFGIRQLFILYPIHKEGGNVIGNFMMNCYKALPEMVGIQMFGLLDTDNYHNQPTWYLCSMIITMIILYCFLSYSDKLFQYIIIPIIGLTLLGWRFSYDTAFSWAEYEVLATSGVVRAASDISLGVICYSIVTHIKTFRLDKITKIVFSFIEVIGWITLCYGCHIKIDANNAIWVVFVFIILMISLSDISYLGNCFKWKGFEFLSKFCFSLYMTHYAGIRIIKGLFYEKSYFHNLPMFALVCIVVVIVEIQCVKVLNKCIGKIKGSIYAGEQESASGGNSFT